MTPLSYLDPIFHILLLSEFFTALTFVIWARHPHSSLEGMAVLISLFLKRIGCPSKKDSNTPNCEIGGFA